LKKSPSFFSETLFKVRLYPYQKEILDSAYHHETNIILKGRQVGLTYIAALLSIHRAATLPKSTTLILSLNLRQAQETLRYCKKFLLDHQPIYKDFIIQFPPGLTETEIRFKNRSRIVASGCTRPNADNVRHFHAHLLIIDEASLLYDKMFSAIEPITARTHGTRIFISTPGAEGSLFHQLYVKAKQGRLPNSKVWELPACKLENGEIKNILCPDMTEQRLRGALETLGKLNFEREYCGKWLGMENQLFPLLKIIEPPYPKVEGNIYGGVDVGKVNHPTVLTLLKGDSRKSMVLGTWEWYRLTTRQQASHIATICERWKVRKLIIDKSAMTDLPNELRQFGITCEGKEFSKTYKQKIIFDLAKAIEEERILIPRREEELVYQLRNYVGELRGDTWKFTCLGGKDDYIDSLALAYQALPKTKGVDLGGMKIGGEKRVF